MSQLGRDSGSSRPNSKLILSHDGSQLISHRGRKVTAFGIIFDCTLPPSLNYLADRAVKAHGRLADRGRTGFAEADTHSGIAVQPPRLMAKEQWFLDAIHDAPDYLSAKPLCLSGAKLMFRSVLAGHMPVRGQDADFSLVIEAIREVHPRVPVFVFGELPTSASQWCRADKQAAIRMSAIV